MEINKIDFKIICMIEKEIEFSELRKKLDISKGYLSKVLSKMEYFGIIKKIGNYKKSIKLTNNGRSLRKYYLRYGKEKA